jgi:4-hydroxy-2-oxoheptanedioate aldolase
MTPGATLKAAINSEQITTGVLITDHLWPRLIEICKNAGLDYAIIDCEHGPHDDTVVAEACQIGRLLNFPVLIRPISCNYDQVRRAIDMGPCGIMLPSVDDLDDLASVRDAVLLPPRGRRRPGGWGNHWMSDFNYPTWRDEFEADFVVLPQIETRKGLSNVKAIAADDIVTAIAVGPYDLSAELGCCWDPQDERLKTALSDIREAGRAAGKNMWMIGNGPELVKEGYTFVCVGEPSYVMGAALGKIVQDCKA